MGSFAQLEFALMCMDFLAWPVIALVFPLVVSIRAIENGSEYHMRKLVIYWTLFSLLSLFEFAFFEIIQWIPIWSSIKLVFTFWLVFPRFHGACYAYDNFIRPWLVLNLREAISRLEDKYKVDTGLDACHKLIAPKKKHEEPYSSQRGVRLNESGEEHDASTLKQLKGPVAAPKDDGMLDVGEISKEVQVATKISKPTSYAAAVTKGILPRTPISTLIPEKPVTFAVHSPEEYFPQQKWRCTLCQVKSSSETDLNNHLRGGKHKVACMSLNLSEPYTEQGKNGAGSTRHWCYTCDVELVGDASLMSHLNGKRHASNAVVNGQ